MWEEEQANREEDLIRTFGADITLRWSCRRGDLVIWLSPKGNPIFLSKPEDAWTMPDIWETRAGDWVTITNRLEDIPPWFELHPTEVCNRLVRPMMQKLNSGWTPGSIMDGLNIWRARAGDRLAWVRPAKPHSSQEGRVLCVLKFRECALVLGESNRPGGEDLYSFGSLCEAGKSQEALAVTRRAIEIVRRMGAPHEWTPTWAVG